MGFSMYDYFFHFVPTYLPRLLVGAITTVEVSVLSMISGTLLGLLTAIARLAAPWPVRLVVRIYVDLCRGIPLVVMLLLIYFALPGLGIRLPAFWAGVLGLSINLGAYLSEVFRSAILAIDQGQRDAALSLGLNRVLTYRLVMLPQALAIAIPTLGGYFISLLKDCALVSFISVEELLRAGTEIIADTFRTMDVYLLVGFVYVVMSYIAAFAVKWMEDSLRPAYLSGKTVDTTQVMMPPQQSLTGDHEAKPRQAVAAPGP
jgi:His/Glu/Gln/Arg/opine family amino acid ABC transporter permease subunit